MDDAPEPDERRITRHVTRRDGRLEGSPDPEGVDLEEDERAQKERQRDLTSLSGPRPGRT